ncbi:pore-forming ESAT-6 family protein [Labrys portucalensis]|uniref:Pore-forming ESAT-6 family protein n=1 Tax=Labrys neptuniae TaxID=376174 RepID=A0ABV6ZSQ2_9HYPH
MRKSAFISMSVFLTMASATVALAQKGATPEQIQMVYNAGRNQLGLLKYCQDKGFADAQAVDSQTKMLSLLPPPGDPSQGDEAEANGRKGNVSMMGVSQDITTAAKAQGVTEEKLCQTLAHPIK